jgi:hypothetical protein
MVARSRDDWSILAARVAYQHCATTAFASRAAALSWRGGGQAVPSETLNRHGGAHARAGRRGLTGHLED